jgi:hypothetical protein
MKRIILFSLALAAPVLAFSTYVPAVAQTGPDQTKPDQTAPQTVPVAPQDQQPGGNLSGQLNRTNGVIHPPAGADSSAVKPTPPVGQQSTPVIPPPGTPGNRQDIEPK